MESTASLNYLDRFRTDFLVWRRGLAGAQSIALALAYAAATGLMAQISFYLPWTPVPVTGETFAVLLGAVLLGRRGGFSQIAYVAIGVAGMPWFAGWKGGAAAVAGPAGGYIIGFIIAAFFLGYWADKHIGTSGFTKIFGAMFFANFGIVYSFGLAQLYFWLSFVKGSPVNLSQLLAMGAIPFLAGDIIKITAAAVIAKGAVPGDKK
jgi:biotin transport system substrate-specific component